MYRNILSPSILAADFGNLNRDIAQVEASGTEYLHIDVMDGIFVPSISFGMPVIKSIRKNCNMVFDVHLMIMNPVRYVEEFAKLGADIITVHVEACDDVKTTLMKIKECGKKVGITLNPDTPVSAIEPYMDMVDMVLVMSVNPGFGGQKFIESSLEKISLVKKIRDEKGYTFDIEVDGGVNMSTIGAVLEAGANVIVAGSAVFGNDIAGNIKKLDGIMK